MISVSVLSVTQSERAEDQPCGHSFPIAARSASSGRAGANTMYAWRTSFPVLTI